MDEKMSNPSVLGDLNGIFKMDEKVNTKDKQNKWGPCVGNVFILSRKR